MEDMGAIDDFLMEMAKTRKQGIEADTIEFVNWINEHDEFSDLLNEKELKKLDDELNELEKWYEHVLNIINKSKN